MVLKLVREDSSEVEILRHLHSSSSLGNNCTIPILDSIHTHYGTIIVMPRLQPLDDCDDIAPHVTFALGRLLLGGISFMHAHGIVHRDIKMHNVVVDTEEVKLFIIDYDLAEQVEDDDDMVCGFVGVVGCTAPEVLDSRKEEKFSGIRADLWAVGELFQNLVLWSNSDPPEIKALRHISRLFMQEDPGRRPPASEALTILNSKLAEFLEDGSSD